jgi:formate hydrogenlyase subunit 6/NADH:ubiquinone oxidoreductase subunit I
LRRAILCSSILKGVHLAGGRQGVDESVLPFIDINRCTGCGLCVERCPTNAVEMVSSRPALVRPQDCPYCGLCEEVCPVEAIALAYEIILPAGRTEKGERNEATDRAD